MKKVLIFALCMCRFCQWQNGFAAGPPDAVLSANGSEATSEKVVENYLSPATSHLAYQTEFIGEYFGYESVSSVKVRVELVYDYDSKTETAVGQSASGILKLVTTNDAQATFDGICHVFITKDKRGIDLVVRGTLKLKEKEEGPTRSYDENSFYIDEHRVLLLRPLPL